MGDDLEEGLGRFVAIENHADFEEVDILDGLVLRCGVDDLSGYLVQIDLVLGLDLRLLDQLDLPLLVIPPHNYIPRHMVYVAFACAFPHLHHLAVLLDSHHPHLRGRLADCRYQQVLLALAQTDAQVELVVGLVKELL